MRKTTALLGLLGSLVLATPALASEAFTLNIPLRLNAQQETGKVKITFTLSAAPAGSQLVVNGTTINFSGAQTIAGDKVTFTGAGGNNVQITYEPTTNFAADFCQGGGATERNIAMRFVGAQDITEYRMSSYIVAAPMADCSQVTKHTGDMPATIIPTDDGVAPALVALNRGRHHFDVVLVLDKSGSMADFPPGAISGARKHEILKAAVKAFVAGWDAIDAPIDDFQWPQDRLGMVFFDGAVASQSFPVGDPPANFFVQRGSNTWSSVGAKVDTLSPGGSTSIGGGINEGMKQWKADPDNDLNVVVVTDGMQNTAPLVQPTASGFLGLAPVSGLPEELRQRFIPIQTIGFGTPAQVDEDLLRNIALETAGMSYIALSESTMFDVFAQTLVAILKGNTAAIATRDHGTLRGKGPTAPLPVIVDRSAQRAVFMLQWGPPARDVLDLEVFAPGTTTPATPTSSRKLPQASLQTFDIDRAGGPGIWMVRVKRGANPADTPVTYTLNVLFNERHLDFAFSFDQLRGRTGDKLGIRATVSWDGKPLTELPAGAIKVKVARPSAAIGTVLHDARVPDRVSGTVKTANGDVQTPLNRKVAALIRAGRLEQTRPKDVTTLTLKEVSRGVYAATLDETPVPGAYIFNAVLDWNDDRTGRLHREERIEQYVRAVADPERTEVKVTRRDARTALVSVTPRDRLGNFLGPGHAERVKVKASAGNLRSEVPSDASSTGTYVFTIGGLKPDEKLAVDVTVDGVRVGGTG
jgi:von Willebrand factor type A domain